MSNLAYTESWIIEEGKYEGHIYVGQCGVVHVSSTSSIDLSFEHEDFAWENSKRLLGEEPGRDITEETLSALKTLYEGEMVR